MAIWDDNGFHMKSVDTREIREWGWSRERDKVR